MTMRLRRARWLQPVRRTPAFCRRALPARWPSASRPRCRLPDSGSLVLTDNALNAAGPGYTTQTILLSGTATPGPATMLSPAPGSTLATGSPPSPGRRARGPATTTCGSAPRPAATIWSKWEHRPRALTHFCPPTERRVYVRLYSVINGALQYNDYTYTEAAPGVPAAMIAPGPGSTLATAAHLHLEAGTGASYYYLWIGTTLGSHNLVEVGTSTTSLTHSLPTTRCDALCPPLLGDQRGASVQRLHLHRGGIRRAGRQ